MTTKWGKGATKAPVTKAPMSTGKKKAVSVVGGKIVGGKASSAKTVGGTVRKFQPPKNVKLPAGSLTEVKKQVKITPQGALLRTISIYTGRDTRTTAVISPQDPAWCKIIWNRPAPSSKNQRRALAGKRGGPRKSRKRSANGLIRQPNNWPQDHVLQFCAECHMSLHVFALKLGNIYARKVLYDQWTSNALYFAIQLLCGTSLRRSIISEKYGLVIPRDVAHIILTRAFTAEMVKQQRLRRDQYFAKCGCRYHMSCYVGHLATSSVCSKHKKAITGD